MQDTVINETIVETAPVSGVAWPAIFGGAIAAVALTMLLFPLGSALGLSGAHWTPPGTSDSMMNGMAKSLTLASVIWLIIVQWISSGFGGYITGRLRSGWRGAHNHEVFFRDTVHGFLSWGVGTLALTALVVAIAAPMIDGGMHHGMMARQDANRPMAFEADSLLRPVQPNKTMTDEEARTETNLIFNRREVSEADRTYLDQLVATRAGISQDEAHKRVDAAAAQRRAEMEEGRKAAAKASLFLFVSMLIGAFIATTAAALGGRHRDVHYRFGRLSE